MTETSQLHLLRPQPRKQVHLVFCLLTASLEGTTTHCRVIHRHLPLPNLNQHRYSFPGLPETRLSLTCPRSLHKVGISWSRLKPRCSDSKKPLIQHWNVCAVSPLVGGCGEKRKLGLSDSMVSHRPSIWQRRTLHCVFKPTLDSHSFVFSLLFPPLAFLLYPHPAFYPAIFTLLCELLASSAEESWEPNSRALCSVMALAVRHASHRDRGHSGR